MCKIARIARVMVGTFILSRRCNLTVLGDCDVLVGERVARQHKKVVSESTQMGRKIKGVKAEQRTKW